jgi:hypothetical protein
MANEETQPSIQRITCVLSEDGDDPFNISYTKDLTIEALKIAICRKRVHKLKHLVADDLKLHLIALGDDGTLDDVEGKVSISEPVYG